MSIPVFHWQWVILINEKNVGKSLAENFYLWSLDFVCVISMSYDIKREILTLWLEKYSDSKVNKKEKKTTESKTTAV